MQIRTIAARAAEVAVAQAAAPAPQAAAAAGTAAAADRAASVLRVQRLLSSGSRGVPMSADEARGLYVTKFRK